MITPRFLTRGLLGLALLASPAHADPQEERDKQLAALEKQLAELQAKLKLLRETPLPREQIIPEATVNKFAWRSLSPAKPAGDYHHVATDMRKPYRVYGGLRDPGELTFLKDADGFVCRADPKDPDLLYVASRDGALMRRDLRTNTAVFLRPQPAPGMTGTFRFHAKTPFLVSGHQSSNFYAAGNYVFKSVKQGDDLQAASPEIARTKRGAATALAESPKNPAVLWVGTDDGAVWITKDGCKTWTNLTDKFKPAGLPDHRDVGSIEASQQAEGRAYVVFDGHRSNDNRPWVFVTEDFGQTWKSITANLPTGSAKVLREDIVNPNLLYLGTEHGVFATVNRGAAWTKINGAAGLPTAAVHEFAQPVTANDLVVATQGRSLWALDVTTLRKLNPETLNAKTSR